MKIKFTLRNEKGLHCRFCGEEYYNRNRMPNYMDLFETSPVSGIVCRQCKKHLERYVEDDNPEVENEKNENK